jgi:lactose/L-arabinose transport system substrate-binding protein
VKNLKKVVSLFVICTLVLSIGAFAKSTATAPKTGKLTIWAWDPNFNIPIMELAAKNYNKANPGVKITVVNMAKADVEQKLTTMLQAGTTAGLPDITLIEDYNAQKYILSNKGAFMDLTKKINVANFAKYKVDLGTQNKKVYDVPFDAGTVGLFYRSDILAKAGFKAADLNNITWDKFIEIGKVVKAKTGKYMLAGDPTDGGLMRIMMLSAGQWYFNAKGDVNVANNAALKESITLLKKMNDAGIVKKTSGWAEWVGAINTGDTATITTGCWIIGSIKAAKNQSGKWSVAKAPRLSLKGSVNYSNLGGSSWYVLDKSKSKELAADFLNKEFGGDIGLYQTILKNNGALGTFLPAQSGTAYKVKDAFFGGQAIFSDLSTWNKKIPSVNYGVDTYAADGQVMAVMPEILSGKTAIADALKTAEAQIKNQLGK